MSLLMVRKSAPAKAADKNENIANDSEIVALWQVLGDAKAYLREGKKNHNVKNVLAAAIKAAEKENPNDRSVLEAKKVLAQFDSAAGSAQDFAAMDAITESDLKKHAHDFARYELGKYADELRKKRNSLAYIWEKTSIAGGAIRSGEYKQADIDEFVNPYVNAIDDAIRILERI